MASNWQQTFEELKKKKKEIDKAENKKEINNINHKYNKTTNNRTMLDGYTQNKSLQIPNYVKATDTVKPKKEEKKWYQKVFDKGAFDDGYDFGDVTKTILGTTADVGVGIVKGVSDIGVGAGKLVSGGVAQVADWIGQDEYADKVRKNIAGKNEKANKIMENYTPSGLLGKADEKLDGVSAIGETGQEITEGVGYLGGMLALQSVGVPWQVTAGVTSAGNELGNAYANNAEDWEAWLSSGISAGVNIATEYLGSGVKLAGTGKTADALIGKVTDKISKKGLKYLLQGGVQVGLEGAEEVLAGYGSAIGQKLTYMDESELNELYSSEDALKDFVIGVAVSGISQGATPSTYQNIRENRSLITGRTPTQAKTIETETQNRIKQAEAEGITLTTKEKNQIEEQVTNEVMQGQAIADSNHTKIEDEGLSTVQEEKEEIAPVEDTQTQEEITEQVEETTTNTVIPPTVEQELTNITNQIDELETMLDTNLTATQQQEILTQLKALEQKYNEILQQQGQTQDEAVFQTANVKNNVEQQSDVQAEEIAPIQETNVEQISNTTTQETKTNSLTEVESNTPNVVKSASNRQNNQNTQEIAPFEQKTSTSERKTINNEVAENLQDKSVQVMTEEEYLSSKGYGAMGYSEPGLHKSSARVSQNTRDKQAIQVMENAQEYDAKREELRQEYQEKLKSGEIRKPTNVEKLLRTAQGHEDNQSVQSARKLLEKRGIDWKTGEKINKENKTPTQEELDNLEDTRLNKSGSEYASAFYDLEKKYGSANLYKGLNNYKSTEKALEQEIAPVKETIEDLTDTIKDTTKEMKALAKEIKEIKSSVSEVQDEFKALTEIDLPMVEQQASENLRTATEDLAPVIEDTTPEYQYENDNEGSTSIVESPLIAEGRDMENVGSRKVKAYQYENPEVRPYFQEMARQMQYDLENSTKGQKMIIGDISQTGGGNFEYSGTKRNTTPDIADLLDNYNYTYADINKGLEAIIKDAGAENIAVAKRIEFALDDRLRNGYTTVDGFEVPANQEYINLLTEKGWLDHYNSIPNNDIAPLENETEQESVIAPATENVAKTPTNQSLAIEQGPTDFDNGGPMIRVSPEMQKRTLNKPTETKNVNWEALEDTSKGEQQTLIKRKLGSTLTDTSIKREQILANEQAEKFGMEAEEQNNAETITQILTEKPQREKGKWDNFNRMKKLGTTKILQKDYYLNKLARESGNQSLSEDSNNLRHANRIASQIAFDGVKEWKIDRTKSRRKGRFTNVQKSQGIEQIYEPIENKGLTHEFDDYAYNLHNIDRMSIESKARDKMTELKDTILKGYTFKQIQSMAKGIDPNEQQLDFDLKVDEKQSEKVINAAKEFIKLSKEQNKTVFGEQITADVSKENIKKYEEYKDTFEKQSQEITKLNDALLDFDVESGRMTAEEKAFIKERYPNYVPVYYAVDETVKSGKKFKTKDIRIKEALEVAEGGSSEIIPLKDAMQIKTRQKVAQNLMNKLGLNIMHTLDKQGKLNVLSSDSVDVMERYTQSNEQLLNQMQDGGYALTVYENGNKIMFEIPLEIYEALKPSDIPVIDTLNTLVDMKRSLLTEYNLYFAVRNIVRDMPTAFLQSQNSLRWALNVPEAIRQVATKGQYYQLAQTLGAGNNDYANMNQRNFADIGPTNANEIRQQQEYQGNRFKTGWEAFKNWKGVKWIADINGFMEQVPRMAEFITSVDSSVQENINPLTGGKYTYAQDEVTVNFGKGGDWTKTADRNITNFMNASLQGSMKLVDTFRDAYAYKGAKGLANTIIKYGLTGASLVALMGMAWGDDDDYEELSDYVKNNYYMLGKYGDGQFIKIPKGRTNAVVESIINNGLGVASGEMSVQDALSDTISVIENNIAPTTFSEANLLSTLKQIYTNTSWYGEDLVPSRLQDLPEEEQYDETTDSFSIWLGQKLGVSPYKINYFLNQSSGFVGDMILPLLTDQAETPIDNDLTELLLGQFYKDFTTDSTMKNQYVTDFYELVDELSVASKGKDATDEDGLKYKYISTVQSQMNDFYAEKREIQGNKDLTDSEKIEALRETQRKIDDLAQQGLEQYNNGTYLENYASIGGVQYQRKENEDGELYWSKVYDDEAEDLSSLGFTDTQLDEYFTLREEFNALNDKYYDSKEDLEKTYGKKSDEYDEMSDELYLEKKNTIIDTIMNSDFSNDQKAYLYDKYYSSEALDTITTTGIDINYFLDYQKNDFKADYNSKGKAIPNSRKNKVISYINDYDLSIAEKAILIKSTNTFKFNDYNDEIVDYISGLDITYEDKVYILNELDMTLDDNGYVHWE